MLQIHSPTILIPSLQFALFAFAGMFCRGTDAQFSGNHSGARPSEEIGAENSKVLRLVVQFAANQHAANLRGAGANLVQLGVAQNAAGRVVVDVAIAA